MFLRKSRIEPLPVTMSAVRMGERVLQIGIDDPAIASALAAKVGLSGNAAIVVADADSAAHARSAASSAGVLVDVQVTPISTLPFENGAFDLVIAHSMRGILSPLDANARTAALHEWHRVLRTGGRVMIIETGRATGLNGVWRRLQTNDDPRDSGRMAEALETAGFRGARVLGEREGYRFTEGIKT
jgi:ubiquinone/menaquinone biosynthesis C-methylase UbiE